MILKILFTVLLGSHFTSLNASLNDSEPSSLPSIDFKDNCSDFESDFMKCHLAPMNFCTDSETEALAMSYCPKKCGFCFDLTTTVLPTETTTHCSDDTSGFIKCDMVPENFCSSELAETYCPKTCGICDIVTTMATPVTETVTTSTTTLYPVESTTYPETTTSDPVTPAISFSPTTSDPFTASESSSTATTDPDYACSDVKGFWNCDLMPISYCTDLEWKERAAHFCPKTCGFCLEGTVSRVPPLTSATSFTSSSTTKHITTSWILSTVENLDNSSATISVVPNTIVPENMTTIAQTTEPVTSTVSPVPSPTSATITSLTSDSTETTALNQRPTTNNSDDSNCEDIQGSFLDCKSLPVDFCTDIKRKDLAMEYCPKSCGFCSELDPITTTSTTQAVTAAALYISDRSCTLDGKYTEATFQCENNWSDSTCDSHFNLAVAGGEFLPAVGASTERPKTCYDSTKPNLKIAAMTVCAKHCGYCCASAQYDERYNCENVEKPRNFDSCDDVKEAQCKEPALRDFIIADCPKSCGFCKDVKCKDLSTGCLRSMCTNMATQQFAKERCAFTCGMCDQMNKIAPVSPPILPGPISPPAPQPQPIAPIKNCRDNHSKCATWVRNNYCTHPSYTDADRVKYCAASCGLCHLVSPPVLPGPIIPPAPQPQHQPQPPVQPIAPTKICTDLHSNCASWVRNNYCTNPFYTDADRVKYCPASCKLCHML